MARVFIGVSWPYANGPQHIGHLASTYVPADQFARFHRLRGDEVLMVSGSDMHGTPILVAAEKEGSTPETVSGRFHELNRAALERLGVSFDVFTTTHTVLHERTAGEVFLTLLEKGFIRRRTEELPFCPKHGRFLPDRYVEGTCPYCGYEHARGDECDHCGRPLEVRQLGSPRCVLDGTPAEFRPSEHFYLELDRLAPDLTRFLDRVGDHWRPGVLGVARNFLAEGLHPTSISRDLDWGVPIPLDGYDGKRLYVWFEAVIGYLSASKEWAIRAGRPEAWRRYWEEREPARHYYFVGKDNKFHHTIVWPAMLIGVGGLHLPYDVPANEWLTLGEEKLSRSRTKTPQPFLASLFERYPPDVIRFYAALLAPQNHDTELDWDEFDRVREDHLANQYGNLVQRALIFTRDRYDGWIPSPPEDWRPDAAGGVGARLRTAHEKITAEYEAVRLKEALGLTLEEVREGNRRFQEARPWDLDGPARDRVVYETLWRIRALATWLAPVLPFSSAEVFRMLGFSEPPGPGDWDRALDSPPVGQRLGTIQPLFPREEEARPAPPPAAVPPAPAGSPAPAALPPLSVRAGVVRNAAPHPSADKLYVLEVDAGEPKHRTIVAGLRSSYSAEQLKDRAIVFVANLAPRTIRRITSQGMVLAADAGERAVLLAPPDGVAPGTLIEGSTATDREITFEEFGRTPLLLARVQGVEPDGRSRLDVGGRPVSASGAWPPGATLVVRLPDADAASGTVLSFGPDLAVRPSEILPAGSKVR
jgi:methionyl-tRNA synthetase